MSTFHEGDRVIYTGETHARWKGQTGTVVGGAAYTPSGSRDLVPVRADADGSVRRIDTSNLTKIEGAGTGQRYRVGDHVEYVGSYERWKGQRGIVQSTDGSFVIITADYDGRTVRELQKDLLLVSRPAVDHSLRAYLVANMLDGEASGLLTMAADILVDEVVEHVAMWMIRQSGAEEAVERYYQEPSS